MKTIGVIAEYNPMHFGHIYHLEKSKEMSGADFVICVISGNFVQRGEPAILNKWDRARLAIENGADLVFEMPFGYCCNSAEYFAKGGVGILEGLGFVEAVSFGSESGNIDELQRVARKINEEDEFYKRELKSGLSRGYSYPRAREMALGKYGSILKRPNNILAVEYLRQIKKIHPLTIKRKGQDYLARGALQPGDMASATYIREALIKGETELMGKFMPQNMLQHLTKLQENSHWHEKYFQLLQAAISRLGANSNNAIDEIFACGEGLENSIYSNLRKAEDLSMFLDLVSCKRMPKTRIMRLFTQLLVGFTKNHSNKLYTRLLGFSRPGRSLYKESLQAGLIDIPIVQNPVDARYMGLADEIFLESRVNDIYNIIMGEDLFEGSDFKRKPMLQP